MVKSKSYADIQKEIEALQAQASSARHREISEVVARIKEAITTYGLTAADLGLRGSGRPVGRPAGAKTVRKVASAGVPKYRDPKSGKTWTGHGKPPNWIKDARDRNTFLIAGGGSAPSGSAASPTLRLALSKVKAAGARKTTRAVGKTAARKAAVKSATKVARKTRGGKKAGDAANAAATTQAAATA